jgi:AcrR family transcriptional regulator
MTRVVQLPAPGRGAYDRTLSRAERDAQHRERLLLAAAAVLRDGPATVARVVERAGVGRSTFYEFFDSPEHLIQHLEQRALRSLEAALAAAFSEARTPLERVRAITRAWLVELETRSAEARVVLTRSNAGDLLSPAAQLLHRVLERCVQASRQDGMVGFNSADDVSLLAAAAAIEAVCRRHVMVRPVRDAQRTLAELVSKLLR